MSVTYYAVEVPAVAMRFPAPRLTEKLIPRERLSERMCQVFLAHRLGYTHEEVGIVFGIMPPTVERYVALAHRVLRESGEWP